MTKECRTLQSFLDQLIKVGKLKQFLQQPASQGNWLATGPQRNGAPQSSLGTINVILATLRRESHLVSRVMLVSPQMAGFEEEAPCKKARVSEQPIIGFMEEDKLGTIQPHDVALMVNLQIAGFDVKRVTVNQGSGA